MYHARVSTWDEGAGEHGELKVAEILATTTDVVGGLPRNLLSCEPTASRGENQFPVSSRQPSTISPVQPHLRVGPGQNGQILFISVEQLSLIVADDSAKTLSVLGNMGVVLDDCRLRFLQM